MTDRLRDEYTRRFGKTPPPPDDGAREASQPRKGRSEQVPPASRATPNGQGPPPGEGLTDADAPPTVNVPGQLPPPHEQPLRPLEPAGDEDAFWDARPALARVRQFARARRAAPWAVLGVVLVRVVAKVPPVVQLPPVIGSTASLNLFVGIVADSGGGKGAAEAAGADCLDVGEVHQVGVGSGEGMLHQYVHYVPPDKKSGEPGYVEQHNDACVFTASEVDTLGALAGRQASTLLPELRKVYMGETLSFAYVDPTKRLTVTRHAYRAGLIVGIQPARAGVLLGDTDGGTPQRFVWLPGHDRGMTLERVSEPAPEAWKVGDLGPLRLRDGRVVLKVCHEATDQIVAAHVARNRGDGDALDGHALLTRLKWAAALGILDERIEVSSEDWQLAGTLMAVSDRTRREVLAHLDEQRQRANRARGLADAEREVIKDEVTTEAAVRRVGRVVLDKLSDDWTARSIVLRRVTSRDRGYFETAVERLTEAGLVEAQTEGAGTHLRRVGTGR